ncbi:class I SAM-dependent methyltransferase [Streptomyces sp. NPDC046805]|uniref:class I SAM-dependent methyltransferase n=1 Tax=Streptomyces sp. NPDC046805 TaxID=3155134 RepID=UPI0033E349E8
MDKVEDDSFYPAFVAQGVGDFGHTAIPADASIWVAGCGTNQALITALRFPSASVVGSDISDVSLEICSENARALGVRNLRLRRESLAEASYDAGFHHVICTGVLHHNRRPEEGLERIARSLRPDGVLELMVYNRFHRREPAAFQSVVRLLLGDEADDDAARLDTGKRIARGLTEENAMTRAVVSALDEPDEEFADEWVNLRELSYTLNELWALADSCGLEVSAPCLNPFDAAAGTYEWDTHFPDEEIQRRYDSLDDRTRWQVTNLLKLDSSPRLWFYLRPAVPGRPRMTESERDSAFLDAVLEPASTMRKGFILTGAQTYAPAKRASRLPTVPPDETVRPLWELADGTLTTRELFTRAGLPLDAHSVRRARIQLTTPQFPHLRAVAV